MPDDLDKSTIEIKKALENGRISEKRLEKSVKKHTVRIKSKEKYCDQCGLAFFEHGAICIAKDQNEEIWSKVCPGDWIIISDHDYWPCPNYLFKKTYKMIREGI